MILGVSRASSQYDQNMVCEATNLVIANGNFPIQYTDANYEASNACYRKTGYKLRDGLTTVGAQ